MIVDTFKVFKTWKVFVSLFAISLSFFDIVNRISNTLVKVI